MRRPLGCNHLWIDDPTNRSSSALEAASTSAPHTDTNEVSEPRMPCFKLGARMGFAAFVDLFEVVGRDDLSYRLCYRVRHGAA